MKRTESIIFILLIICISCFGQTKPKSNLEIFDETISAELEKLYYYPGVDRNFQFIFVANSDSLTNAGKSGDGTKFLVNLLKKTASDNKLKFSITYDTTGIRYDSAFYLFLFHIKKLETSYPGFKKNNFLGEKTVMRNITALIGVKIQALDRKILSNSDININHNDEVSYDNYESLESSQYEFTQAKAPQVSSMENLFFPILLIIASAVATFLFFVIRTK